MFINDLEINPLIHKGLGINIIFYYHTSKNNREAK